MPPPPPVKLPQDELSHHKLSYAEWWYFHGHMYSASTGDVVASFEYTIIELARSYYGYAAVADLVNHEYRSDDRVGGSYAANTTDSTFKIALTPTNNEPNGLWRMHSSRPPRSYLLDVVSARQNLPSWAFKLKVETAESATLVGDEGRISDQGDPAWLYSRSWLEGRGGLKTGAAIRRVHARAWMDHQWGIVKPGTRRWNWFGVQLDDKRRFLFFVVHALSSGDEVMRYGYEIATDGAASQIAEFKIVPKRYWNGWPIDNDIEIDSLNVVLEIRADIDNQLRVPKVRLPFIKKFLEEAGLVFWEGACSVSVRSRSDKGRAYTELGGY